MNADGLSYIDLATEAIRSGPKVLVNGYWSPLYPSLIAPFLLFIQRSPEFENPVVHFLNWLIFVGTALSFMFFLNNWKALRPDKRTSIFDLFAFALFFWSTGEFIKISEITPDLCVAAIVLLSAGLCCRFSLPSAEKKHFFLLGITLALGYYAKAAMFPAGLLLLAVLFFLPPSTACTRPHIIIAGLTFALASVPLVFLVSQKAGHLSIGEAGALNYAWYVNEIHRFAGWTGGPLSAGEPLHAPIVIDRQPLTLVFGSPIKGTYPLWFDPSYWYQGIKPHFNLGQQIHALTINFRICAAAAYDMSAIIAGLMAACLLVRGRWAQFAIDPRLRWAIVWPVAVLLMYLCVHLENRFLGGFIVLFWLAVYQPIVQLLDPIPKSVALTVTLGALLVPMAIHSLTPEKSINHMLVARALNDIGIQPNDQLAVVGSSFDCYYAHLARVRVTAQIPVESEYWASSPNELHKVHASLARIGIRAMVTSHSPAIAHAADWQRIAGTEFSLLMLDNR